MVELERAVLQQQGLPHQSQQSHISPLELQSEELVLYPDQEAVVVLQLMTYFDLWKEAKAPANTAMQAMIPKVKIQGGAAWLVVSGVRNEGHLQPTRQLHQWKK